MSLLVRAAILGGLAYVVSRAVRNSQYSLDSSRSEARRLARAADQNVDQQRNEERLADADRLSATNG